MRKLLVLVALLAFVPGYVLAQGAPPAGPPGPPGGPPMGRPDFGAMRQRMQQMEAAHKQLRAKVLGALTPAHRNLLASLVGQLAISTNPDPQAAIKKLDAALSSGEKSAITNAMTSFMNQMHATREQMIAKMHAANPNMPSPPPMRNRAEMPRRAPDPGRIVFMLATLPDGPGMGGEMMLRNMHRPGMMWERRGPRGMRSPEPSATP